MNEKDVKILASIIENASGIKFNSEQVIAIAAMFKVVESAGHKGLKELNRMIKENDSDPLLRTVLMATVQVYHPASSYFSNSDQNKYELAERIIKLFNDNK